MFKPVGNKELLSNKVAFEIESVILNGKLKVGSKLPSESDLCLQFGVSRTAIREALKSLSAKGFISIEKGRGIFVKELTSKSVTDPLRSYLKFKVGVDYILDIITARQIIEPEIARMAAKYRNEKNIEEIKLTIEEMKNFSGDPAELARLDMNFHLSIAKSTQNNLLPLMLKPIFKLMPEIKSKIISDVPEARNSALVWHNKIMKAIINKDSDDAYKLMKRHLDIAKEHAEMMMKVEGIINS